ncbi:MAG: UDP-glucuronic acid decarboxylase family protein [Candidatus Bathyarchaeia archaeon]
MRILITGGAGFIGSHLCKRLLDDGHSAVCFDNLSTSSKENVDPFLSDSNFTFIEGDVKEGLPDVKCDVIYHLAARPSPIDYMSQPVETLKTSLLGGLNVLEFAYERGCKVIFGSSSEVYGSPPDHAFPTPEGFWGMVNPIGVRSCYDEGKRSTEALCAAYNRKYGLKCVVVRIFNCFGPKMRRGDGRVIPTFISQALVGEPITVHGDGNQTRSFCYVSDLISGMVKLLNIDLNFLVLNLGNPEETRIIEIARTIKRLTKSSSPIVFIPQREDEPPRRLPDVSKAKRLLGWKPEVNLEEGLRKTIDWFKTAI